MRLIEGNQCLGGLSVEAQLGLAEEGLEMVLQKRAARKAKGFRLVTFGDPKGEPVSVDWEALRGLVYPA